MKSYNYFISRKVQEYGEKFDHSALSEKFIPYYENGKRKEVDFGYLKKRGTVGVTTGWRPVFILLLTKRSEGSSFTLSDNDNIIREVD